MRQIYLCDNCKRSGIKTSKAMLFETFFCPKCKKNTTLFLPKQKPAIKKPNSLSNPVAPVAPVALETNFDVLKNTETDKLINNLSPVVNFDVHFDNINVDYPVNPEDEPEDELDNNLEYLPPAPVTPVSPCEPVSPCIPVSPVNPVQDNKLINKQLFYLRDVMFYLIGFITALLIMKN